MDSVRPWPRYPNYGVTRDGRVLRIVKARFGRAVPYELKQTKGKNGYMYVGGGNAVFGAATVHRAVAETFIPNPNSWPEVAHNDGDRAHNAADNLRWATRKDNFADRVAHGTDWRGSKHRGAKINEAAVAELRAGRLSVVEAALLFNMQISSIRSIRRGEGWRHV